MLTFAFHTSCQVRLRVQTVDRRCIFGHSSVQGEGVQIVNWQGLQCETGNISEHVVCFGIMLGARAACAEHRNPGSTFTGTVVLS